MPVTYLEYARKKLNEVVLLGSHDAGITHGNENTKTQTVGIYGQALNGARFFDLRIAAFVQPSGDVAFQAYHDDTKTKITFDNLFKQDVAIKHLDGQKSIIPKQNILVHKTLLGSSGEGLSQILNDAVRFVSGAGETGGEFLILKFDKCENWPLIAKFCTVLLGDKIYIPKPGKQNLNDRTLWELAGKVIVLFDKKGWDGCGLQNPVGSGILQWKNLYNKKSSTPGPYVDNFAGLQYYGKGGVSAKAGGQQGKIEENSTVQAQLMTGSGPYKIKVGTKPFARKEIRRQSPVDPNAVGLMYWTTTGPSADGIEDRNEKMWLPRHQQMLIAAAGFSVDRVPAYLNVQNGSAGAVLKSFLPNVVMVDFVTENMGRLIKSFNTMSATEIQNHIF